MLYGFERIYAFSAMRQSIFVWRTVLSGGTVTRCWDIVVHVRTIALKMENRNRMMRISAESCVQVVKQCSDVPSKFFRPKLPSYCATCFGFCMYVHVHVWVSNEISMRIADFYGQYMASLTTQMSM